MKFLSFAIIFLALSNLISCRDQTDQNNEFQQDIYNEFAKNCDLNKPLHYCSMWFSRSVEEWDEMILYSIGKLNPPLKDNEKIFDLGVGVGAVMQTLLKYYPGLWIGGSDLADEAIAIAKKVFPEQADHFFVHDMTKKHESIPDNSFDHVVSFGALGQYLTKEQMIEAIKEATRMTIPGGSMLFTSFLEPDKKDKYIRERVEKAFWEKNLGKYGIENVQISDMKNQGQRYQISCNKKK